MYQHILLMGVLLSAMRYHDTLSHYITDGPYLSPLTQRASIRASINERVITYLHFTCLK